MIDQATKGLVFNIQRYSIHDGPGIRTTVFLKGCPLRCFWCQNPESWEQEVQIFLNREKCTRCGRCVEVCPIGASRLLEESSTIDRNICIKCGRCVEACPNEARRLVGWRATVEEVVREVKKDVKFYENSNGGVTFSGGEPTAQPRFLHALLVKCKELHLHTTLDTCGCVRWSIMEKLLNYVDLVFYDIKHVDTWKHLMGTGKSNELILDNARKIASYKPMRVRVPVIPGFNSSAADIGAIAKFVKSELGNVMIDLLPYNIMPGAKYAMMDKAYNALEPLSDEEMRKLEVIVSGCMGVSLPSSR